MMIPEMPRASRWLAAFAALMAAADSPRPGKLLFSDDFTHGLGRWSAELEKPGVVEAKGGILNMDVPAGCTAVGVPARLINCPEERIVA